MITDRMYGIGVGLLVSALMAWSAILYRGSYLITHPRTIFGLQILGVLGMVVFAGATLHEAYLAHQMRVSLPAILRRLTDEEREVIMGRMALQLYWAYEDEILLQSGRMPLGGDPHMIQNEYSQSIANKYRALRNEKEAEVRGAINKRYDEFWGAHKLYKDLGYPVKKSFKEYLPTTIPPRSEAV